MIIKKYSLVMIFFASFLFGQNKLDIIVKHQPPIVKIDSSTLISERNNNVQRYNTLIEKINRLENNIAENKTTFFDSIANWYSFVLIALSISIAILGIIGYGNISRRFDNHKSEVVDQMEKLREVMSYKINERLNIELQRIDDKRKSFYDKSINDLTKKYYELSSLLETIKIVYISQNGKPLVPNALESDDESDFRPDKNAFEEDEDE